MAKAIPKTASFSIYKVIAIKDNLKYCLTKVQLRNVNLNKEILIVNIKNKTPIHSMLFKKPTNPLMMTSNEKWVITPISFKIPPN